MEQNQNELKNIINKNLKIFFKKEIKGNFLIKILSEVKDAMGQSINSFYHPDSSITVLLSGSYVFPDYDICKMIIGLHKSNMIFLSEEKQIKSINDTNYQASLKNSVIQHIKLRPYGSCFFRNNPILTGDRFLYFELPYTLFVICMKTIELLPNNTDKNIPTTSLIRKMSQMGLSALTLLENNMLDDIYPVCRGIIELFMSFLCLSNNKKAISKYNKLSEFEAKFSRCGQPYPDEFHDLYNNRKNPDDNVLHSYLHYGWVDDIPNYHKIVKRKPYSTKGLFKYLENENNKEIFSFLSSLYERCHSYSHANTITSKYPLLTYFETTIMLHCTITTTYKTFCSLIGHNPYINDIDIVSKAEKAFETILNQYNNRNTTNFNNYYLNKNI